jgi:hypothetical protein
VKNLAAMLVRDVDRATTTLGRSSAKSIGTWPSSALAGRIDITTLTQPWLRELAKHWASEDLARRRGDSAGMVARTHIGSLAELSTTLRLTRVDYRLDPTALGRTDIVAFLTRLGHLEQTEAISANRRYQIVRHVRTVLCDARDLGMTRAGGCFIATLTPEVLAETRRNPHAPEHSETVLSCLHVILDEEWEHHRYGVRDLDTIEAKPDD